MTHPQRPKSATSGTKFEEVVGLGSEFPICKDAQKIIEAYGDVFGERIRKHINDCFLGFSFKMQMKMVDFFISVYKKELFEGVTLAYTGVKHVDNLLKEMYILLCYESHIDEIL